MINSNSQKIYAPPNNSIEKSSSSLDINEAFEDTIDEIIAEYKPPKLTDKELVECFPEAKDIIPLKIKECKLAIKKKENEIQSLLKNLYTLNADEFSTWFGEEIIKVFMMPDLVALEKNMFRLRRFQQLFNPGSKKNDSVEFEEKIEIAKKYPIDELARSKLELRQSGRNWIGLCPFHDEKSPSFYLYADSNRYHCYGCQNNGSVIDLTMALYGCDFKTAVEMLQN